MIIESIEYYPYTIPLKSEFKIATGTSDFSKGVIVKIKSKEFYGLGEGSPSKMVLGETQESTIAALELFKKHLIGRESSEIENIMEDLDKIIYRNYAAKSAIDIALHDLLAKEADLSLKKMFGGAGNEMYTSITIGIEDLEKTVNDALKYKKQEFKILKIKIGLNLQDDILKLRKIREAVSGNVKIRIDGNQGYKLKEAMVLIKNIEELNIEFIEQPVPYWDIESLKALKEKSLIPIMADESVKDEHDLNTLIKADAIDLLNIKIMKVGGFIKADMLSKIAKANGVNVMIGCMSETKLGITAGMHFALSQNNVKYIDLDSHLNHAKNFITGGVKTENGKNIVNDLPGLGLDLYKMVKL